MINLNTRQRISGRRSINDERTAATSLKSMKNLYFKGKKSLKLMDIKGKLLFSLSIFLILGALFFL